MIDDSNREVEVFNAALQLPALSRRAYLKEACAGDAELYHRIETLLQAHEEAGEFLKKPAAEAPLHLPSTDLPPMDDTDNLPLERLETYGERSGRYKLLQQIGEGGCGIVYLAEQEEPVRRRVAMKLIKLGLDTKGVIARFEAERQALAMMDHPNIARVLDGGATATGRPFFVMELVRGIKITDYCNQHALSTRDRLRLFVKVCGAIQHAHQKSVIHRDIKPSNILVTVNDGEAIPKVIDFGIAKATEGRLTDRTLFTAFEHFIGTPAYMSPEQAAMTSLDVDTRSDIYSLGVLLYELVTGQTPFDQKELLEAGLESMRQTLRKTEPVRPSTRLGLLRKTTLATIAAQRQSEPAKLMQLVRGDLDWIAMKCLEKERVRRYATASDLAADVERFLHYEPIAARPPSFAYRLEKFIRRNTLAVAAVAAVAVALLFGLGISAWQYLEKSKAEREQIHLREEAEKAQAKEAQSRHRAEALERMARKKAYASDMNLLQQALAMDDLGRAQELLNRQVPAPGEEDLRGWEWRYFWQFCQSEAAFTLCQRSNSIISVSFSSDGSLLAVGTYLENEVSVWDRVTRQMVFRHGDKRLISPRLAFAPKGSLLAYYSITNDQRSIVLWDSATQTEIRRLPLNDALRELAFTRDNRLYTVETSRSNNFTLWDTASGRALTNDTELIPTYAMGKLLDVSGDGTVLVHALQSASDSVSVLHANGKKDRPLRVADELTTAMKLSEDGQMLATGSGYAESTVKLWDVPSQKLIGVLEGHRSWVSCLKFLPDGKTLASASADRTVRLWDIASRRPLRTLRGQSSELWALDVSPDGRWLAAGAKDGSVCFWDLASTDYRPPAYRTLPITGVTAWQPTPDGRWLSVIRNQRLELYDADSLQSMPGPSLPWTNLTGVAFSPDMKLLVTADSQGYLSAWDMRADKMIAHFVAHAAGVSTQPTFLDHGKSVLTFAENEFKEWDVTSWKLKRQWTVEPNMVTWSALPSANAVAAGWGLGMLEWIPLSEPEKRKRFAGQSRIKAVELSPDGKTLAAASENGTLELWNTETGAREAILRGVLLGYHSVAISPDGQRVGAGSNGQEAMKIWDLQSYTEVATLPGQGSYFINAAFTSDGNSIGAANWKGVVHLWTAPAWKQIEAVEANHGAQNIRPISPSHPVLTNRLVESN